MNKLVAVVRLIRPLNCLIMGTAVLVGIIVTTKGALNGNTIAVFPLGFITGFTFLASANAINDYYDRNIDKINEPNRAIPSGAVKPSQALVYAAAFSVIGLIAAIFTSVPNLIIAVIAWFLFTYYATKGKRAGFLGNIVVSTCIALPFLYGGFAVGVDTNLTLLLMFTAMAFFSTLGREVTKGIVDAHGDQLQGVKTIAVLYGSRNAAITATVFYLATVAMSTLPFLLNQISMWYLPFVILADAGFMFTTMSLLRNNSRDNARRVKKLARIWMVIGLLAFIAGMFGQG